MKFSYIRCFCYSIINLIMSMLKNKKHSLASASCYRGIGESDAFQILVRRFFDFVLDAGDRWAIIRFSRDETDCAERVVVGNRKRGQVRLRSGGCSQAGHNRDAHADFHEILRGPIIVGRMRNLRRETGGTC